LFFFSGLFFFVPALIVALVLPQEERPNLYSATRNTHEPLLTTPHQYRWDPNGWRYVCTLPGCTFSASTIQEYQAHQRETIAGATDVPQSPRLDTEIAPEPGLAVALISQPANPVPEFKLCPDCAEEIRYAARKCRFCGYRFAPLVSESLA
jgi:hypothetical protein